MAANISINDTSGCRIHKGASSVRYAAVAIPNGTAIRSAIREETNVPYMNGNAPNSSATGSQVDVTRNRTPNFFMASRDPLQSSQPTKTMSNTTANAIASVSHSNALSPNRDGGDIRACEGRIVSASLRVMADIMLGRLFDRKRGQPSLYPRRDLVAYLAHLLQLLFMVASDF